MRNRLLCDPTCFLKHVRITVVHEGCKRVRMYSLNKFLTMPSSRKLASSTYHQLHFPINSDIHSPTRKPNQPYTLVLPIAFAPEACLLAVELAAGLPPPATCFSLAC
jgi:hypothetical protein